MPPTEAVIGVVRLVIERMFAAGPVEFSAIHHNAAQAGAVSAEPFGQGVDHNIGAMVQRPGQIGGAEGGVHHQGKAMGMGDGGDGLRGR